MSGAVVLFFTATLAALGFGRLRLEGIRSSSPLGPRWLATFALPIGGIVLAAVLAAAIFSHRFLLTVVLILSPVLWLAGLLLRLLIVIVALMAFLVIAPLLWLLERSGFGPLNGGHLPEITRGLNDIRTVATARLNVADPLRYLLAGIILFRVASALTRYAYRRHRRWRQTTVEERDSVFVLDEMIDGLMRSLRRVFRPSRRVDSLARLRGDPRWAHTVAIRETYRRLQHWGEQAGLAREEGATPEEYGPALAGRVPQAAAEIALIVDLYNAARYSGLPATGEEAERVHQAWTTMRKVKV